MTKKLPLERRKPKQAPPKIVPKLLTPSNDTSRDFLPPGWRRGLIPRKSE
ncbi:MAG: hypothetical protein ACREQA_19665 [Candidatus Binatia bacterium]